MNILWWASNLLVEKNMRQQFYAQLIIEDYGIEEYCRGDNIARSLYLHELLFLVIFADKKNYNISSSHCFSH